MLKLYFFSCLLLAPKLLLAETNSCLIGYANISAVAQQKAWQKTYTTASQDWQGSLLRQNLAKNLKIIQRMGYFDEVNTTFFLNAESQLKKLKIQSILFSEKHQQDQNLDKMISLLEKLNSQTISSKTEQKKLWDEIESTLSEMDFHFPNLGSSHSLELYLGEADRRLQSLINKELTTPATLAQTEQDLLVYLELYKIHKNPQNQATQVYAEEALASLKRILDPLRQQAKNDELDWENQKIFLNPVVKSKLKNLKSMK